VVEAAREVLRQAAAVETVSSGGSAGGSAVQSGSRLRIAAIVSEIVSPENARLPANISYSTQPKAQTSVRLSTAWPRACSGLMYAPVPRITPSCVGSAFADLSCASPP